MHQISWERLASMLFCLGVGVLLLVLAFRYALPILFPFLIAWGASLAIRPLAQKISHRLRISQKLCAVILLILILGGALFLLCVSVQRLILELQHLLERLLAENEDFSNATLGSVDFFEALTSKIGFLRRLNAAQRFAAFREQFNGMVTDMLSGLLTALSSALPTLAGKILSALPGFFIVTVVTVIAGFYFCTDGERITAALTALLPKPIRTRIPAWKSRLKGLSFRYARAYLLLLGITFAELFLGFSILGVDYAFLLALAVALVDMLPILGVGTVLVPWAVVMLLQHNYYLGFGLLILYFAALVLRQIIEPRLIGHSLGLHPLLALFATYAGWELLGFFGMIMGPLLALLVKSTLGQFKSKTG